MNVDYTVHRGQPVIYLFARDEQGLMHKFIKSGFKPYFYVEKGEGAIRGYAESEETFIGIRGEELKKITMQLPREVGDVRKDFDRHWEADINFPIRFLIDSGVYCGFDFVDGEFIPMQDDGKTRRKRVYVDIEVETKGSVPKPGEEMILVISIVSYDPNVDKTFEVEFGEVKLTLRGEYSCMKLKATTLEDEVSILERFIAEIRNYNPDDIAGWNIHFDLCTIIERCKFHRLNINNISPMGYVAIRDRFLHEAGQKQNTAYILGRSVVDVGNYRAYPNCFASYFGNKVFESYKLKDIAAGDPKETDYGLGWPDPKFDYEEMNRAHPNFDIDKIAEYCMTDVMKVFGIDMKLNLIDHFDGIRRVAGSVMDKSLAVSAFADILMLRMYNGYLVCPSKQYGREGEGKFKGAGVIQPDAGFYKWVDILDFKQMYPLNAISRNMSPETVTDATDPDVLERPDDYFIVDDVAFKKHPKGKFCEAFEKLIALRDFCKAQRKLYDINSLEYKIWDLRQYSVKQMSAAMYGFSGFKGSRFYDRRIAKSITFIGRKLLMKIVEMTKEEQLSVLYGDTDGIMVMIPEDKDAIEEGMVLEAKINSHYQKVAIKQGMTIPPKVEFEKVFRTLLFSGKKKRYAGRVIWEEGKECDKMYVRGFEMRSSISAVTSRDIQKTVLKMICYEESRSDISRIVKNEMDELPNRPWDESGIPKTLKRNLIDYETSQANYLGVWFANKFMGKNYGAGGRVLIFWVRGVPYDLPGRIQLRNKKKLLQYYDVNRIAIDSEEDYELIKPLVNWEVQKEKVIEAKLDKVLRPYGITISEIMSGLVQKDIGAWIPA